MITRGYITLVSVLVVGAIGASVAVSMLGLGLASSRTGLAYQQLQQARALADACAEEALLQVRTTTTTGSLALSSGQCTYVITTQGQDSIINATGTVNTVVRKVRLTVSTVTSPVVIASWVELP